MFSFFVDKNEMFISNNNKTVNENIKLLYITHNFP